MSKKKYILFLLSWVMIVSISFQLLDSWNNNIQDTDGIELVDSESEEDLEDELEENYVLDILRAESNEEIYLVNAGSDFHLKNKLKSTPYFNIIVPPPELV